MADYLAVTEALRIAEEKTAPMRDVIRAYKACCGGAPTPENPCQCKPKPADTAVIEDDLARLRSLESAVRLMNRRATYCGYGLVAVDEHEFDAVISLASTDL